MTEASIQFHIQENDFFGTVATILDLVSQDLRKKGQQGNAETLRCLRDNLVYLQDRYHIRRSEKESVGSPHRPVEWIELERNLKDD